MLVGGPSSTDPENFAPTSVRRHLPLPYLFVILWRAVSSHFAGGVKKVAWASKRELALRCAPPTGQVFLFSLKLIAGLPNEQLLPPLPGFCVRDRPH